MYRVSTRTFHLALGIGLLGGLGCDGGSAPPEPQARESQAAAPAEKEAQAKGPVAEDATFRLALQDGGEQGLTLSLDALGGYHINQDFPFEAELSSSSAKLAKTELSKSDAQEFGEQHASFPIGVELPPGEHEIVASVRFAVCTDETCIPDKRELVLRVAR